MIIKVTEDHINKGKRGRPDCCPVAKAIAEVTDDVAIVGWTGVTIGSRWYQLPSLAQDAILRFDCQGVMQPFEFHLPDSIMQQQ